SLGRAHAGDRASVSARRGGSALCVETRVSAGTSPLLAPAPAAKACTMLRDSHAAVADASGPRPPRHGGVGRRARGARGRPPSAQGWRTTDEEEIALRRWRGQTEISGIAALEPKWPLFGAFRVGSGNGGTYEVEIRSLESFTNSCDCIDHRVNGL